MTSHQVQLLFVGLALILLLARALGRLAVRLGQPQVVGEIVAGVLLGPTLFHGAMARTLFPTDIRPLLQGMADVGLALFMFCIGLELELDGLRGRGSGVVRAAAGSMLVPFGLGLAAAGFILQGHPGKHGAAASTFFVGLALSVTAFPVLARILADRRLSSTFIGGYSLATAAVVDIAAWTGLAAVQASYGGGKPWAVALMIPFIVLMFTVVRPLLRRFLRPGARTANRAVAIATTGALLCGAATEAMGMHFIFGAFLFGTAVPRDRGEALRRVLLDRTSQITAVLLPVYFVVAGLSVDLGHLAASDLLRFGVILLVAVVGKIGGTYLGARVRGLEHQSASALAVLMNTRGLTELVILGVGLQLGLLDGKIYSLMVAMAVVTTAMTGPLLARVHPGLGGAAAQAAPTREPEPELAVK